MADLRSIASRAGRIAPIVASLAALLAPAQAQSGPQPILLELTAATAEQREGWQLVDHTVATTCRLRVWAESDAFDPTLELESEGRSLGRDKDSGGGTTAMLTLPVEAGAQIRIRAGATDIGPGGTLALRIVELVDGEEVQSAVREAREHLGEARARHAEARFADARASLNAAVDRLSATLGIERSEDVFTLLGELSREAMRIEEPEIELSLANLGCEVAEALFPRGSRPAVIRKTMLANALRMNGRLHEAVAAAESSLAAMRRLAPPGHKDLLIAIGNAAVMLGDAGELIRSRDLWREALDGFAVLVGREHEVYIRSRINLATTLMRLGDLQAARRIGDESVVILERTRGPDDELLLAARSLLGGALFALGDVHAGRVLCERVLESRLRTSAPDSFSVLQGQMSVGNILMAEWQLDASAEYLDAAWKTASATRAGEDPLVLELRGLLCELALYQGDFARALEHSRFRLACFERNGLACDDREMIETRTLSAQAWIGLGDFEAARAEQEQLLVALTSGRPDDDPEIQNALMQMLRIRSLANDPAAFGEIVPDLAQRLQKHLATCALTLAPREAEAVAENRARLVSDLLTLSAGRAAGEPAIDLEPVFGLVEGLRGIGGRALRIGRLVATEDRGPQVESARKLLCDATGEIAAIVQGGGDAARLQAAVEKKERAQRSLLATLGAGLEKSGFEDVVTPAGIAARLALDEAAIGYWIHEAKNPRQHPDTPGPERLIAFVVRHDASLVRVDLGPLAPIAEGVHAWREAVVGAAHTGSKERETGETLRRLIVDPVRAACGDARRWTVALDGSLHLVPLEALPDGDVLLGDRIAITIRPTLAEIVTRALPLETPPTLLALGGIEYDAGATSATSPTSAKSPDHVVASLPRSPARNRFAPLPDSAREVDAITALFRTTFATSEPRRLAGDEATKAALVEHARDARWLHVATHGFFGFDPETTAGGRGRVEGDPVIELRARQFAPLVLSGLALAGANQGGVITAEEMAALDLSQCELIVLSACDTNVGTPIAGQGIASFQKALHAAGARTVVTSSWKVSDEATRELMTAFYRGIWQGKLSKSEALRRAKSVLRERRAPTRDWAGWILSGEG